MFRAMNEITEQINSGWLRSEKKVRFWVMLGLCWCIPAMAWGNGFSGSGAGTEQDPYQITSWAELDEIRNNLDKHFILMNDLSDADAGWADVAQAAEGSGWVPLGDSTTKFTGSLDGQGYSISDLQISRTGEFSLGLFGQVEDATIENLNLVGFEMSLENGDEFGGLVGSTSGTTVIDQVTIDETSLLIFVGNEVGGLVGKLGVGSELKNAQSAASLNVDLESVGLGGYQSELLGKVGGLVGLNWGKITNSQATGDVYGQRYVGGLVGYNQGENVGGSFQAAQIINSFATGDVSGPGPDALWSNSNEEFRDSDGSGGLVGRNDGAIDQSYATGAVTGFEGVGGLVGSNSGFNGPGSVSQSHATGAVRGVFRLGGLVGESSNGGVVTDSYATGDVLASDFGSSRVSDSQKDDVGGLIGFLEVSETDETPVSDAYALGDVTGVDRVGGFVGQVVDDGGSLLSMVRVYAIGAVTGSTNVGGLIGEMPESFIENSDLSTAFWATDSTTQISSAGGVAKTSAQLRDFASYSNSWNANGATNIIEGWQAPSNPTWGLCSGSNDGTPFLLRQFSASPCVATPPTELVATAGDGEISVAFSPGNDFGVAITNYEYSIDEGDTWTAFDPAKTASPVIIDGLTNAVTYSILLRALNTNGASGASEAVSATPQAPPAPTLVVSNLIIEPRVGRLVVRWEAPTGEGASEITHYRVLINDAQACEVAADDPLTCTVDNLDANTDYQVSVVVVTTNGVGPAVSQAELSPLPVVPVPTLSWFALMVMAGLLWMAGAMLGRRPGLMSH